MEKDKNMKLCELFIMRTKLLSEKRELDLQIKKLKDEDRESDDNNWLEKDEEIPKNSE